RIALAEFSERVEHDVDPSAIRDPLDLRLYVLGPVIDRVRHALLADRVVLRGGRAADHLGALAAQQLEGGGSDSAGCRVDQDDLRADPGIWPVADLQGRVRGAVLREGERAHARRTYPTRASRATSSDISLAIRERGTTRSNPASSASRRRAASTCE